MHIADHHDYASSPIFFRGHCYLLIQIQHLQISNAWDCHYVQAMTSANSSGDSVMTYLSVVERMW